MNLARIAIVVAAGVLFVAVPSAVSKGGSAPSALTFSAVCTSVSVAYDADGDKDTCEVTGEGLAAHTSYRLGITDSCGILDLATGVTTSSTGTLDYVITLYDPSGCEGWTFSLFGARNKLLATTKGVDAD